jgi:beta-mannosidase
VRDHYVGLLFGIDPGSVRHADPERYLELGRVASGEVMAAAFAEWRRAGSTCRGALIWFLRDLWPGAGWGIVDALGRPKAAWHLVRSALQPVAILMTDEGLNGLALHVVNERGTPLDAEVRLDLYRRGETRVGGGARRVSVAPRSAEALLAAELLEGFTDTTCAYRFGPPGHDLAVATLATVEGATLGRAFHAPQGFSAATERDLGLEAEAAPAEGGAYTLTVRSRRFAHAVAVDAGDFVPEENYFHIPPGGTRDVRLRGPGGGAVPRGGVKPLNAESAARIVVRS